MKIDELDFSVRTYNCLKRARIDTVEQLSQMTDDDLMRLRNFGQRCLAEVREKIAQPRNTIADLIRGSDNEKMATALAKLACPVDKLCKPPFNCHECWLEVIQQPAEEDPHGK